MTNKLSFTVPHPLNTAVLFLVFNRLNTTKQVFGAIREAKPPRLYVAADGARANKEGEVERVQAVRDFIMQNIDWDCEVKTLFREQNLGCKYAVSGAIKWFFENEEQGIILEDDCLPSQSFFWFCEDLLNLYKSDLSISLISGRNDLGTYKSEEFDYFLTYRGFIWGWATWADRLTEFDVEIGSHSKPISMINLIRMARTPMEFFFRLLTIKQIKSRKVNSWAYPLSLYNLLKKRRSIVPTKNLVVNLGFGHDATHTKAKKNQIPVYSYSNKLKHDLITDDKFSDNTISNTKYEYLRLVARNLIPSFILNFIKKYK